MSSTKIIMFSHRAMHVLSSQQCPILEKDNNDVMARNAITPDLYEMLHDFNLFLAHNKSEHEYMVNKKTNRSQ